MAIIPISAATNTLIVIVSVKLETESNGSNKDGPVSLKFSSVETVETCRLELSVTVILSIRALVVDSESIVVSPTQNYSNSLTVKLIGYKKPSNSNRFDLLLTTRSRHIIQVTNAIQHQCCKKAT